MASEAQNIITNIIPRLEALGWERGGFQYEVTVIGGEADIVYAHKGKNIAVIEAKRVGGQKNTALEQAKRYAQGLGTPLAIATDGATFLHAHHMKKDVPLLNHEGKEVSYADFNTLSLSNILHFIRNPALSSRIVSESQLSRLFDRLNDRGRAAGLTSGVERLQEIAKIVFIKMLVDNDQYLEASHWDTVVGESRARKIGLLNHHIGNVRKDGVEIDDIKIDESKAGVVEDIVKMLHGVDFNNEHYDVNSTLFQNFLSERARGGGTNDLGQYFTPQKIIRLMVSLADYKEGDTVYDPCCGTAGVLCEFLTRQQLSSDAEKKKFGGECLFGSEISKPVANLAKMNMVLIGDGHSNIIAVDSLIQQNKYMEEGRQFNHVVTNIPFDPKTPSDGVPQNYFKLSHDGSEVANFVEHCINRCKMQGRIVLIVGRGFLTERKSASFRRRLLQTYDVQAVYDLYSGIFAPYTPVHSCLFVINKTTPQPGKSIDFFAIADDADIETAEKSHNSPDRYKSGYYRVPQQSILESAQCDLRGSVYQTKRIDTKTHCRIGELVSYIPSQETKPSGALPVGLKKMTTPNSIAEGIRLIESKSNKQVKDGYGSFACELQKGAIVVSRITNKRVAQNRRYFGSAIVGDDAGNLITQEYYQLIPTEPKYALYVLYHLRTKQCQQIAERASGTSGQQRIAVEFVLEQPIPRPTPQGIKNAENALNAIEMRIKEVAKLRGEIEELAGKF